MPMTRHHYRRGLGPLGSPGRVPEELWGALYSNPKGARGAMGSPGAPWEALGGMEMEMGVEIRD